VSATAPQGDDGGNQVLVKCDGCQTAQKLHAFWGNLPGTGSIKAAVKPAIAKAKELPAPDATLAAKLDEKVWIAESFDAAKAVVYQLPIGPGSGPFTLTDGYKETAKTLGQQRLALAGARLGTVLNAELK